MRIPRLKTELLHPVDEAGRIRTPRELRSLCRQQRVTYFALDGGSETSRSAAAGGAA